MPAGDLQISIPKIFTQFVSSICSTTFKNIKIYKDPLSKRINMLNGSRAGRSLHREIFLPFYLHPCGNYYQPTCRWGRGTAGQLKWKISRTGEGYRRKMKVKNSRASRKSAKAGEK